MKNFISVTKKELYDLMTEIAVFYRCNQIIPTRLDNALRKTKQDNYDKINAVNSEIQNINKKYADKNEAGEPVLKEIKDTMGNPTKQYQFDATVVEARQQEIDALWKETLAIKIYPVNEYDLGQTVLDKSLASFLTFEKLLIKDGLSSVD